MGYEMLLIKSPHRMESRKLGLALLVGFCIGVVTSFISITLSTAEQQFSWTYGARANPSPEINPHPRMSDAGRSATGVIRMNQTSSSTNYTAHSTVQAKDDAAELASGKETEEANHGENAAEGVQHTTQKQQTIESKPPGTGDHFNEHIGFDRAEAPKAACDLSNPRTDVCELHGDVRIHGKSSSVVLVSADRQPRNPERRRSWQIKPYARKFDKAAMAHIQEVSVGSSNGLGNDVPRCTTNYSVPAVVFAIGGYTGNYYHDFTDVLVPLFITSRRFDGEVQLVIATKKLWWISKYEPILRKLSRYEIVYSGSDDRVHCYPHAIVGLHSHKAMSIDPARAPNGYSMVDFTRFMRSTYSLGRDFPIRLGDDGGRKPRLLLIPRQGTRRFTNFQEIVGVVEESGFEVVVAEAKMGSKVAEVARVVNSCDVMMGVHGAGLTNFVFLPTGAVIIQVVPFGNLENISRSCFGYPSEDAKLHYLEYSIREEESSLIEQYPRDHPVFKDPKSIHRKGWNKMGEVYLDKQNVKLDVNRFRPLLQKARQLLHR
ncbi:Glycosyltransferase [Musa troglodytarum]|uniref:Glycosyltransferase n=1 Tax=Musa troglodytarum TaxID=320322 RepID=A0A9E7KNH7_9LILI|nr:Glycosyltransferase [Musa troglodytarum]